ncbi:hypothetical protein F2Q69_00054833 [Brassica cretica]|uniref:Zinc knuckle CX2CX4HX4C domain-containing protein n=1 Tax=Brassica cretica TaxID=69181 RepID=A0A8S9N3W5_BRACR|nr:hypothetical protein F2Q69_00054833 [Brassica cretica]
MFKLASEVGKVEEIAYDPKISQSKDYIRALITFDTEKPAKASRKLTVNKDGATVTIEFEYERIHKRCFHSLGISHEKVRCPMLKRGASLQAPSSAAPENKAPDTEERVESSHRISPLEGPPGFPPLFPELPPHEQKAAMLYISHADATERHERHVYSYPENNQPSQHLERSRPVFSMPLVQNELSDSSLTGVNGLPGAAVTTGFQIGLSAKTPLSSDSSVSKQQRRRPPSWKRKAQTENFVALLMFFPGLAGVMVYGSNVIWTDALASVNWFCAGGERELHRGRFYLDNRMFSKDGFEEAITLGWGIRVKNQV